MSIIDISVLLRKGMPLWPDSAGISLQRINSLQNGDKTNDSVLTSDVHAGTHVEVPLHYIEGRESIDQLSLGILCGPVIVADLTSVGIITGSRLEALDLSAGVERLVFKTGNSELWNSDEFTPEYVALSEDGAEWITDRGIKLVGIDYLSIAPYNNSRPVHHILLQAGVTILEGINLSRVLPGQYELICLPLKLMNAEAAPARAILRPLKGTITE